MSTLFRWVHSKNPPHCKLVIATKGHVQCVLRPKSLSFRNLTSTGPGLTFRSHFMVWIQMCESDVLALSQIIPFLRFEILKIENLKIIFSTGINQ